MPLRRLLSPGLSHLISRCSQGGPRGTAPLCSVAKTSEARMGGKGENVGGRVLSIQSHVVHGHVGNKSAVFPLQLLGLDVDFINTVTFSNHTGYPSFKGTVMSGDELWDLVQGLGENGLLTGYTHLLTGYIGSLPLLETIAKVCQRLRDLNPSLVYVCDPVMGDDDRLYIKPEMVEPFRDLVVPLGTLVTPNQFEAEQLTGRKIETEKDALAACEQIHAMGPESVVVTSLGLGEGGGDITIIGSTTAPQLPGHPQRFRIIVPRMDAYFTGTGDLLAALLLGWTHQNPGQLAKGVELGVASLQEVLRRTAADGGGDKSAPPQTRELRLVQSREALLSPDTSAVRFREIGSND